MYILNGKEKLALITIARRKRIDYLKANRYTYLEDDIDMFDENIFVSEESIERDYERKYDSEICVDDFEKIFKDPFVSKSAEALTNKERSVLLLYYGEKTWKDATDKKIGEHLNIKGDTARKIRNRAKEKIRKEYSKLKGERNNDI